MDKTPRFDDALRQGFFSGPWHSLYLGAAILSSLGLIGKLPLLHHVLPLPLPLLAVLLACGLLLPFAARFALRFRLLLAPFCLLAVLGGIFVAFPRTERLHSIGKGSDQPDCVIVGSHELLAGHWPYRLDLMWSHHPMSCGPGWVAAQAPVTRGLGYPANMAVIWLISLIVMYLAVGRDTAAAMLLLLCFAPSTWLAIANGTDFLTFGIGSAAIFAAAHRWKGGLATMGVLALLGGLIDQFRITTTILPALLATSIGPVFAGLSVAFALAVELCFLFWNSQAFLSEGPLHVMEKLVRLAGTDHVGSGVQSPWLLAGFLVVPVVAGFLLILLALRRWPWERVAAVCFALLFVLPALLDMRQKWQLGSGPLNALQSWEGGMWMMACLPLSALLAIQLGFGPEKAK